MTDTAIVDYRRKDQNRSLSQPYWLVSAEIDQAACEDKIAVCFSFPLATYGTSILIIEKVAFLVTEAIAGGTPTITVGACTLATDAVTTAGVATVVDVDYYMVTADVTVATPGIYFASGSAWLTARALQTEAAICRIVPAATAVPAIGVWLDSNSSLTTGKGRLLMLVNEMPLV